MNQINKIIAASVLLFATVVFAFGFPKHKYEGTNIIASLNLPQATLPNWHSEDVSYKIDLHGEKMNFLSHVLAIEYAKDQGPLIFLLIIDADNFHYPKTCVAGAGYDARDLEDIEFKLPNHTWKAKAIYFQKGSEGFLTVYWMCIDKKQVDWTSQKLIQLWYSLLNKQKTGLMVRMDIEAPRNQIGQASQSIQEFLSTLATQIPTDKQEYLFGK